MTTATAAPGAAFTQATVAADGFTIRYYQSGHGDTLVMLHGAGGPAFSQAHDLLAERFRVILVEMPGYGDEINERTQNLTEMAETISQVLQALGVAPCHVLGTSMGGAVATYLALNHPEQVASLVLEAPATFRTDGIVPGPDVPPDQLARAFRSHPERGPARELPDPAKMARVWPLAERLVSNTPVHDEALAARLSDCPVRTLAIYGDDDGVVPAHNGRVYRRQMPNCSYIIMHQAAHDIQADRPEAFTELVADFLTRGLSFLLPEESTLINP